MGICMHCGKHLCGTYTVKAALEHCQQLVFGAAECENHLRAQHVDTFLHSSSFPVPLRCIICVQCFLSLAADAP